MKKNYILLALLPVLFQSALYCAEIDQVIMSQLKDAQAIMKSTTIALNLQSILDALVLFAKKGSDEAIKAVDSMKSIKVALAHYREEKQEDWKKSRSWSDYLARKESEEIKNIIDPAIKNVDNHLKQLEVNSNNLGFTIAATAAGFAAAAGIGALALWYFTSASTASNEQEYLKTGKDYSNAAKDFISDAKQKVLAVNQFNAGKITLIQSSTKDSFNTANTTTVINEMKTACQKIEAAVDMVFTIAQENNVNLGNKPEKLMLD